MKTKDSKYFIIVLLFYLLLCSAKCSYRDPNCNEKSHYSVVLRNKSKSNINFHFYWNYPDTLIGEYNPVYSGDGAVLHTNDSFVRAIGPKGCCCWESNLANGRKEWVYIFDQDTIRALSWEIVRKTNRGLLERRLIDLDYLRANDFQIIYK